MTFEIDRACGPAEYCHCNRCRKRSGSASLLTVRVNTKDFRLLTGREFVKAYAAPILYSPPAYQSCFCSNCGSPVPELAPNGDSLEIPAGLFDDNLDIRPDKHIFVDFMPPWDDLKRELPAYTLRQIYELRTGRPLPPDFVPRLHGPPG
ncbi:MAG TPA: GFA family protein [Burkholderiaceae bacterium]|nr:GFA family protein [Burkholderiaceae bacterium]